MLESWLFNKLHQARLRNRVFEFKQNERSEPFGSFAQRLLSTALTLLTEMPVDLQLNRQKSSIFVRLRDQANLITETFQKDLKRLSRVVTAQIMQK